MSSPIDTLFSNSNTNLSVSATPSAIRRQNHRHRRSAAISGDFDIMGLGLFSPPNGSKPLHLPLHNHSHSYNVSNQKSDQNNQNNINTGSAPEKSYLDKHFHFNNEDDFTNKPTSSDFAFPNKTPDLMNVSTPPRYFTSSNLKNRTHNLNSPIKLNHRHAMSTSNTPRTKFFLTEETNMNNENVPDAVIDLDEILNANLHIGDHSTHHNTHRRSGLLPHDIFGQNDHEDDFLASPSPFFKNNASNSFNSSPLSIPNHITLFQQPIQEKTSDSIEEDDENNNLNTNDDDEIEGETKDIFTNPQDALIYSNDSANSSNSSLKSNSNINRVGSINSHKLNHHLIEKTLSNSSKESNNSSVTNQLNNNSTPTSKRSGAKANRYQSFYDQSFKITNALKFSSSESINLVRSNSSGQNLNLNDSNSPVTPREILSKSLGHSSSLPSLKSNLKRNVKFQESRLKQESRNYDHEKNVDNISFNPSEKKSIYETPTSPTNDENITIALLSSKPPESNPLTNPQSQPDQKQDHQQNHQQNHQQSNILATKNISNSPISVTSDVSSTVLSTNEASTDHSSLISLNDNSNLKKLKNKLQNNNSENMMPSIVISKDGDVTSSSSTNSTFKQVDEDSIDSPIISKPLNEVSEIKESSPIKKKPTPIKVPIPTKTTTPPTEIIDGPQPPFTPDNSSMASPKSSPKKAGPRRPLSPSEEKILKSTQIPSFKNLYSERRKSLYGKDKEHPNPSSFFSSYIRKSLVSSTITQPPPVCSSTIESPRGRHSKSKSFSLILLDLAPGISNDGNLDDNSIKLNRGKNNKFVNWFRKKR